MIDRRQPHPRRTCPDRRRGDRRQDQRLVSEAPLRFLLAGQSANEVLNGELCDVSPSGLQIHLDRSLAVGSTLLVEVQSPVEECFNLTGQVVWCRPAGDEGFQVGCELCVELSARQFALLRRWLGPPAEWPSR